MEFNIIYNKNIQNIIGINEELPFKITKDMIHFKNITTSTVPNKDNVVIMGFNTWKSLPNKLGKIVSQKVIVNTYPADTPTKICSAALQNGLSPYR